MAQRLHDPCYPNVQPAPPNQLRFPNIDTNSLTNERQFLPNHGAERQEPSEKTWGQKTDGRGRGVSSKRNRQTCQTEDGGLPAGGRREARHEVLKPAGKDAVLGTARPTRDIKEDGRASVDRMRATNEGGDFLLTQAVKEESFPEMEDAYSGLSEEERSIFPLSPEANEAGERRHCTPQSGPATFQARALHTEAMEQDIDFHIHKLCLFEWDLGPRSKELPPTPAGHHKGSCPIWI